MSNRSGPIRYTSRAGSVAASTAATQAKVDQLRSVTGRTAPQAKALADAIERKDALREAAGQPTATKRDLDAFEHADDSVTLASWTYDQARRYVAQIAASHRRAAPHPVPKHKHKG